MNVLLISTYELGRQPFGIASPAAWLRREGCAVTCVDLAVEKLPREAVATADLIAFHVPMHTATRLATRILDRVREINPSAHLCFYGLYAPVNEHYLRTLGADSVLGGEFERSLAALARRLERGGGGTAGGEQPEPSVSLERQTFLVPDRDGLPALDRYARLQVDPRTQRTVGYTEASRGCRHLCRHCPIVPVYGGRFRVVQREVVLEDVRRQVLRGAEHITFGDPDFFNGPGHALALVREMHRAFPDLTYDVTIKVEHLLRHREHLAVLRETGCAFVTSAVEAVDDATLLRFDKGHTRDDFIAAVELMRGADLVLSPTFVTFTPWTTIESYLDLLELLIELKLVDQVAPIQYAIRLLIIHGSKLLELPEVRALIGEFDEGKLAYPWVHSDPRVDRLQEDLLKAVGQDAASNTDRRRFFRSVWRLAQEAAAEGRQCEVRAAGLDQAPPRASIPYLTEPWYC